MKRWLFLLLFGVFSVSSLASAAVSVQIGCKRLSLVLATGLSPSVVNREWASGIFRPEAPAVLELRGCKGQLLDRIALEAPLARLEPAPLRGAPAPTYLVSVDLTQAAGSYNGPLTFPVQVVNNHLQRVVALADDGRIEPIHLPITGKAAWKKISIKGVDNFISVSCQPQDKRFVIIYRRYNPTREGWRVHTRSAPGFWESDGEFPEIKQFP
jgi:hypothetical protein